MAAAADAKSEPVHVCGHLEIFAEKEDEFLKAAAKAIKAVNKEKGCIYYNFHKAGLSPFAKKAAKDSKEKKENENENKNKNVTYCIMEKWESQAHLDAHLGVGCDAPAHMQEWFKAKQDGKWGPDDPGLVIFFCDQSVVKQEDLK